MASPYMTIKEVAAHFAMGESTIYRMIADKNLPHIKIGGTYRVRKKDIETIEKKNYVPAKRKRAF